MTDGNKKYYIDQNREGLIYSGWVNLANGDWIWLNDDGTLYSGWKYMSNGKWFYL